MAAMIELYPCECDCSGLALDTWEYEDLNILVSLWRAGRWSPSWRDRLRHAWHCLRHGHPYTDDVILSRETAARLGISLLEAAERGQYDDDGQRD